MSGEAVVSIQNLSKSYGSAKAVRDLDLEIRAGERFGLIGPDGAGKTTLLRILCGLILADGGRVSVLGFDPVNEQDRIKDLIGYMPQRFSLYPDLTVAENIRFFADAYRVPKSERLRLTDRLMQFSRLAPFKDRRAAALSGGMKQKLALSCTLIHTPKLLILDEPTTGVDPVSRDEFWDILDELQTQGVTILVTTPYMDEAARCDCVALMYGGRIMTRGTPAEVVAGFPDRLVCVYTAQPHAAAETLKADGRFPSVQLFGDRVHVVVKEIVHSLDDIRNLLVQTGPSFTSIEEGAPDLEDVFVSLLSQSKM